MTALSTPSAIGFEGFEKRLEITFSESSLCSNFSGLRALTRAEIELFLEAACCSIVSSFSNDFFDSYVLSESSLFVFPNKIVLKTCGTTKLLHSVPVILRLAQSVSLVADSVKYSRGSFIFPEVQPSPHSSFAEEVAFLNAYFGGLSSGGAAYVIGDSADATWHVYSASDGSVDNELTVEMCMTGLDREKASVFYKTDSVYKMTKLSGISDIIPSHAICDYEFVPCGYSMNGIDGSAFSTIHVTPEDGFSYASYEAMGFDPGAVQLGELLDRVLRCFRPGKFTVAVTCDKQRSDWATCTAAVDGYACDNVEVRELTGGSKLVYLSFSEDGSVSRRAGSPRSVLHGWAGGDTVEMEDDVIGALLA